MRKAKRAGIVGAIVSRLPSANEVSQEERTRLKVESEAQVLGAYEAEKGLKVRRRGVQREVRIHRKGERKRLAERREELEDW